MASAIEARISVASGFGPRGSVALHRTAALSVALQDATLGRTPREERPFRPSANPALPAGRK